MCGIAGFSISDKDHRVIGTRKLSKMLLREIQARGTDATGAVWSENGEDGVELYYAKDGVDADTFIKLNIDLIPQFTRTALLHTRYATQGSPDDNSNNHPILVPSIIGIHNGHIANDDAIIEGLGVERIGEVDSEAIFQLIANSKEPLKALLKLRGRAAIAWYEVDDPSTLHLARLTGSPMWVGHTHNGSLVFASTRDLLVEATLEAGVKLQTIWEVPEMLYMKIVKGKIVERIPLGEKPVPPVKPFKAKTHGYISPFNFNKSQREEYATLRERMDASFGFGS